MKDLKSRLAALEKAAGADNPKFAVTFADSSKREMTAVQLIMYGINRQSYVNGHRNADGGIFENDPEPEQAYIDYKLISGDRQKLSPFLLAEIEYYKNL